jgi:hypothetical protein
MNVSRAILAGAAAVQFGSLVLVSNPATRSVGLIAGMVTGTILLLLALRIPPRARPSRTHRARN